MSNKPSVLITGGAGFLGINLVRFLLAKNYEVISYDRLEFDYPEKDQVKVITADIRDYKKLLESLKGVDMVVHTAAALPLYAAADIYSTEVEGTANVAKACLEQGVERLVHISSSAVYGIPDHHPLLEDDKLDGVGPYGEAKILAEYQCLKYAQQGLNVSIIRPKSFIGPERLGVFAVLYDWARSGHGFPIIGKGDNLYQLLDVEDLCAAIWLCLTGDPKVVNDIFNIGAKEYGTVRQDYQAVLDQAGFGKKVRGIPEWFIINALRFLELLHLSPLYKWVYETAGKESFVSIEKAEKKLGYKPRYSNKDALLRNYQWYLDNYQNFANTSGVTHRVPWKQGALQLIKLFF